MCQAEDRFGGRRSVRLCLPALLLFVAAAPGGCPGCLNIGSFELLQAAQDIDTAAQLRLLVRLVRGPGVKKLKEFGRAGASKGLAQAREAFDAAVTDAERDLRQKWPGATAKIRLVSESTVVTVYDGDLIEDITGDQQMQRLSKSKLPEVIRSIAEFYPEQAGDLPGAEDLQIVVGENENADDSPDGTIEFMMHWQMHFTSQRPEGEFRNGEELERARLRTDPYKATFRIVYEIMAEQDNRRPPREPVLAVEVVTLSFEFRGERWELVTNEKGKPEDAK